MGYNTYYRLEMEIPEVIGENLEESILKESLQSYPADSLEEVLDDSCKWYDHELDMLAISEKYPKVVFHLSGEGDENDDLWHKDFWAGRMQERKAVITYPDYDPTWGGKKC